MDPLRAAPLDRTEASEEAERRQRGVERRHPVT
jgi:hypothetical protein